MLHNLVLHSSKRTCGQRRRLPSRGISSGGWSLQAAASLSCASLVGLIECKTRLWVAGALAPRVGSLQLRGSRCSGCAGGARLQAAVSTQPCKLSQLAEVSGQKAHLWVAEALALRVGSLQPRGSRCSGCAGGARLQAAAWAKCRPPAELASLLWALAQAACARSGCQILTRLVRVEAVRDWLFAELQPPGGLSRCSTCGDCAC